MICSKSCDIHNFLAILELCAFYAEYKNVKFTAINFLGQTNVRYFMQTQLWRIRKDTAIVSSLLMLKITTKSIQFLPAKNKIPILRTELQTKKILKVSKHYI